MVRGITAWALKSKLSSRRLITIGFDEIRGLDITLTTTARNDEEGRALLEAFRFPFRSERGKID
ncbi:MAG: hypothetical protein CM1200mP36_05500 [Gammaproteobacteria bacterium]|nr:MAG: hypothetical protein CM1200mP36_05500 [Gammaproteobacteria bacterium]